MFVLAGASVDIPYKVYKVLGYLGPKLYFLRLPKEVKSELERLANMKENFGDKEELNQNDLVRLLEMA